MKDLSGRRMDVARLILADSAVYHSLYILVVRYT